MTKSPYSATNARVYQSNRAHLNRLNGTCLIGGCQNPVCFYPIANGTIKRAARCLAHTKREAYDSLKEARKHIKKLAPKLYLTPSKESKKVQLLLAQDILSNKTTNPIVLARRLYGKYEIKLRT